MILPHHSPSSLNLFCASCSMYVLERILGQRQPVGVPAHRGTAVEAGVAHGLLDPGASLDACIDVAFARYDTITALSGDARREKFRATIPAMVEIALGELRPYGIPSAVQGFVKWHPDGLQAPIIGYFDFQWESHGIVVDLKTTDRMPSAIKVPHARQVGLYAATISDNIDARLTYTTPAKCTTYRLENIRAHRDALRRIAMKVERFLALSDDPQFFVEITAPDLESFYWGGPVARQLSFKHWNI